MDSDISRSGGTVDRRTFLKGAAGAATVAAATGPATAQSSDADLSSWFEDTSNYDGVVDKTGQSEVTVEVGAEGNGGAFAFGPAAIRVDPGTTVVWEWTGEGGAHNVVAEDGTFGSEMISDAGHTFEYTADEDGVFKYLCEPHAAMGMRGAIVVGSDAASSDSAATGSGIGGSKLGEYLTIGFGGVLVAVLLGLPLTDLRRRRNESHR